MKYIFLSLCVPCFGSSRDSRELRIICHHLDYPHLERHNAFRIPRSRSLPHIFEISQDTIIEIPHHVSEATIVESMHHKDKKETCCGKHRIVLWVAMITTGGVVCSSMMATIVALVIHFAG